MSEQPIQNPHDQFFRAAMSDKRVSSEFLKQYLPKEIVTLVDFNDLVLQPRSQVNTVRKESTVDLLFQTKMSGKKAYLYLLLEHQSSPDRLMSSK
jgi:predicted transposase/invertase (TIGR01784 family)